MALKIRNTQRQEIEMTLSFHELAKIAAEKGNGIGNFKVISTDIYAIEAESPGANTLFMKPDGKVKIKVILEADVIA